MSPRPPRTWIVIALALLAGAALRLWFVHAFSEVEGDSLLYADIARNWLSHGTYGRTLTHAGIATTVAPTLVRLPGYPAFLAICFRLFGAENYSAVLFLQVLIDLASCLLLAAFVHRIRGQRAACWALWLAALCPFTANYVATPLTETPSVFCVALCLYAFAELMARPRLGTLLALAFAWSYAALLRPDGALLGLAFCPAIVFYGRSSLGLRASVRLAIGAGLLSLLPFAVWTARNAHTFGVFQPLAPRSATDPGEPLATGFQRWTRTWLVDYASTYEIYWNVPGDTIDARLLPDRAFDLGTESETRSLIAQYDRDNQLTPRNDAAFARLAAQRIRARPLRYYVTLPLGRLADMWLRPRVEMLDIELRWWQYSLHRAETRFAYAYGALNLLLLAAAVWGLARRPRYGLVMGTFVLLRCLLLLTVEAPEPRYTLECFPVVIALAAGACASLGTRKAHQEGGGPSEVSHPQSRG